MRSSYLFLTLLAIVFGIFDSSGQSAIKDSTFLDKAEANALVQYSRIMRYQALIFNGSEYQEFDGNLEQHPYFQSEYLEAGTIRYDGELYPAIPLFYDLTTDELIIEHYDQKGYQVLVKLRQDRVQSFEVFGHSFQRLSGDSLNSIKTGFYDVLYDGDVKLFARRRKVKHEELTTNQLIVEFNEKTAYYLWKGGRYYPVKSKRSILKVLKDKKKLLNQFSSKSNLDYHLRKEASFVELIRQYDKIKND